MSALVLRPYQREGIDAVRERWSQGVQRPAVVWPTGAGKTVGFSELARQWVSEHRFTAKQRVLVLAHREELIEQAAAKIRMMAPECRVGIVKAERDNATADIVVGSVQTLRNERRRHKIVHVGLVIVDECHHAVADTYRMVLEHYGCFNEGGARAVGFTATMSRTDDLSLGEVWQEVCHSLDILPMVRDGWLVPPRGKLVQVDGLDLGKIRKSGGDYQKEALGRALEESLAPEAVARAYREHSADRQGILFAPTVHCSQVYGEALKREGFKTVFVDGKMPAGLRRDNFERIRQGDAQVLSNCMVATEGTDLPMISSIVVGRPTQSQGLFVQMTGRGLRLYPGKTDCLVLIVAAKAAKLSLSTPVELFGESLDELSGEELEQKTEELEELLLGLDGELGADGVPDLPDWVDGKLITKDIDLFHASKNDWKQTRAGIWFLPCGERFILLRPQPGGTWGVLWCHERQSGPGYSGWIAEDVPDMGYAMAFAEANVSQEEKRLASKKARWRAFAPTEKTKGLAARLGIPVMPGMLAGELSGLITVAIASNRIDPFVPGWRK